MLVRFTGLVDGLVVRAERMRENVERGLGLHASSRVLVALVEEGGLSREDAYAIVQRDALRAADERRPLRELLAADPAVAAAPVADQLEACFDDATSCVTCRRSSPGSMASTAEAARAGRDCARCSAERSCARARCATSTASTTTGCCSSPSDRISAFDVVLPTADPRQGPRPDRPVALLVRRDRRHRAEPPARHRPRLGPCRPRRVVRRRLAAELRGRSMICRRARPAGRGHRARLPGGERLEGLPRARAPCAASRCRRACARASGCRSRSSRRRRRPRGAHDENIDFDAMVGTSVGGARARPSAVAATWRSRSTASAAAARGAAGIILADTKFEFGIDRGDRRAAPHRRGPDARLVALLGRRRLRAGRPAGLVRQAVRARLAGDRLGQDRARARSCRPTSWPARARATSRPSSASPAGASSATSQEDVIAP